MLMLLLWYVCDGQVEEYNGQEPNWKYSVIVLAADPEDALYKVMQYNQRRITRVELLHNGHPISEILQQKQPISAAFAGYEKFGCSFRPLSKL